MKFEKKKIAKKFFKIFFDEKKSIFAIPCSIEKMKYWYIKITDIYLKIVIKNTVITVSPHKPHDEVEVPMLLRRLFESPKGAGWKNELQSVQPLMGKRWRLETPYRSAPDHHN